MKYAAIDVTKEAHLDYIIEMDKDSDLYMFLPTKYERNCNIWVQDEESYLNSDGKKMEFAGCFFVGDNYSILDLGHFVKDQAVRVRVTIDNDEHEAYWCDSIFCTFDKEAFMRSAEKITARSAEITEFGNRNVTFECTADSDDSCLFTTIPDEPGWVITVNGAKVAADKCCETLITIPLRKGSNTVKMYFDPDYFRLGKAMTAAGVLIIIIIFLFEYKNGKIVKRVFASQSKAAKPENAPAAAGAQTDEEAPAEDDTEAPTPPEESEAQEQ